VTDVETLEYAGVVHLSWSCQRCGERVERALSGRPWYCIECGYHDRDVELQADDLADRMLADA
jgi:ribosomal protein S27AE